jgi:hypothetical protein
MQLMMVFIIMGSGALPPKNNRDSSPLKDMDILRAVHNSPSRNSMVSKTSRSNKSSNKLPEIYTLIDLPEVQERPS